MQSFEKMPAQPAKEDLFFLSANLGFKEGIIKLEPNIPVAKMKGLVGQVNNGQTGLRCRCSSQAQHLCFGVDKYPKNDCITKNGNLCHCGPLRTIAA